MKKNRLLFLLPLIAAFALTSCDEILSNINFNGPRKKSSQEDSEVLDASDDYFDSSSKGRLSSSKSSSSSYHKHTWGEWVVVRPATCYEEGLEQRECSICHATQTASIARIDHQWGEWEVAQQVTCYNDGIRYRTCQICGERVEEYIPATGHTWGEPVTLQTATCTRDGIIRRTCSTCREQTTETVPALGHDYDFDNINWEIEPSCLQAGKGTVQCRRCGTQLTLTNQASDHNKTLVDYHSPESGKANVRVYRCIEGCNIAFFSFSFNQVTTSSASHLVYEYDENGVYGARFWGRPIGNDVALDENGVADGNSHEPVFNASQTGDYFEFVFDLTANQVSALGNTCALYCDATPAPYMYQSGLDFWARRQGDEDWTPGYYIDDNPDTEDNEFGKQITNYRYALYVDNQLVEFDSGLKAPVPNGNPRGEYMMPYIFRLHSGTNRFRLHMAGGYRSLFHNFIFRSLNNNHTHTLGEWRSDENNHWKECTSANCYADEGTQYNLNAHSFGDPYDIVEATCDLTGSYKKQCTVCGYVRTFEVGRLAHVLGDSGTNIGDLTPYQCTACHLPVYEIKLTPQKLKSNLTFNVTGLEPGTYEVLFYACTATTSIKQDIVANGSGRYQFMFDTMADYASPQPGTYAEYGFGTGTDDDSCQWSNPLVSLETAESPTTFTVRYGGQGYSAYVNSIRLVKVS